ncbi:hypothetical protein HanIR_Chr07g0309631 [Helianthus annuus]|nr:hypothetical protein HanIR_Chr07g0309631 [Helianthus annuus]
MQVWLVMDGWGRMGMFVVVMVSSWWVCSGRVNMGSWLLVEWLDEGWLLDYVLLIRSVLEIQEAEELKIQECFYVLFFCRWIGRIVMCLGRSQILLIHFVRLAALGVVYSLGFMSRESKPL